MEMLVDCNAHIEQWSHAAVRLQSIRAYREQGQGNGEVVGEQFDSQPEFESGSEPEPTLDAHIGCFFVLTRGEVRIRMADEVYHCRSPYILHGGEATGLSFEAPDQTHAWSGYLVVYEVVPASSKDRESLAQLYSFAPAALLPIQEKCEAMEHLLQANDSLDKLQAQSYFVPFVHEILRQRKQLLTQTGNTRANMVSQAIQYIQVHYSEPITAEKLASRYHCSTSYLSRLFRSQIGLGPIEYLIHVRVHRAKQLLLKSGAKIQDIASQVGYADVYYFSRLFKKYTGHSPLRYRAEHQEKLNTRVQNNPLRALESSIVSNSSPSHNENESYYQWSWEGDTSMFRFSRPAFGAMMVLCTSLILSACQASTTTGGTTAQQPASSAAAATVSDSIAVEMRTYTHLKGQSDIPVHPQRVVSLFHLGEPIALGVKPVGTTTYVMDNPHISDKTGITDVGVPPDAEKILALEPDLIVTTPTFAELVEGGYEALNRIAPTIVVEQKNDPIKDVEMFGDILGKQEEAKEWIAQFETKIAAYKEKIKPYVKEDETFTILNVRPDTLMVYGDTNMGGNILYKYLGLKPAAKVDSDVIHGDTWEISSEVIPEYIGDRLFLAVNKGAEEKVKDVQKLIDASPAGKSGHVYSIDFDEFLPSDAIAVENQLDIITDILTGKAQ
ncbi:AraC family transcriptional regulator [Paenibacillus silvae]|uniref:AraC family transcriptional regulator n=1 Tax=Paenibacillus silvae TaxID=1325358 RepID=UPI003CE75CD7